MRRGVVLSMLVLGVGCGENVLVGNLQLRSLSDAGADIDEAIEAEAAADAGPSLQGLNAAQARAKAEHKAKSSNDRPEDKGHN